MSRAKKKKSKRTAVTKRSKKAPWGYRIDGKPKRKPGRKKGSKNKKAKAEKKTKRRRVKAKRNKKG